LGTEKALNGLVEFDHLLLPSPSSNESSQHRSLICDKARLIQYTFVTLDARLSRIVSESVNDLERVG